MNFCVGIISTARLSFNYKEHWLGPIVKEAKFGLGCALGY